MSLSDLTAPEAVLRALDEFDELGRDAFLSKYGFGKARSSFLVRNGRSYDSKAIAGAAHGFQHLDRGPLRASDFNGGDNTVRARLAALGFEVVVSEPRSGAVKPLRLFEDYSRREVHDIFAPGTPFTPGAGLWGLQGIVEHQPGEFVLFVTIGQEQGDHVFDEGVSVDGVVTWQSQPKQTLADTQVRQLIDHDSERSTVHLFLQSGDRAPGGGARPYTHLGRLAYLTHDAERERPVYFQWQLLDGWPPPESVLARIGLGLSAPATSFRNAGEAAGASQASPTTDAPKLVETTPPSPAARAGSQTATFRARKAPDRSRLDAENRALGLAGEVAVIARERAWLHANGRTDLAARVQHVAVLQGDGAGYDIASFELDGRDRFIEVKTTCGRAETDFFVSANEVAFSQRHAAAYYLYRLYDFDRETGRGSYYVLSGSLESSSLQPTSSSE